MPKYSMQGWEWDELWSAIDDAVTPLLNARSTIEDGFRGVADDETYIIDLPESEVSAIGEHAGWDISDSEVPR